MIDPGDTNVNQKGERYEWIIKTLFPVLEMGFAFGYSDETYNLCWLQILARNMTINEIAVSCLFISREVNIEMEEIMKDFSVRALTTAIETNLLKYYQYLSRSDYFELYDNPQLTRFFTSMSPSIHEWDFL